MGFNPAKFIAPPEGVDRPVEQVSWEDAMEFCHHLKEKTGHIYRLPSEAEWEYACRAGTETPFHFGETITWELANYRGQFTYASEPEGVYYKLTKNSFKKLREAERVLKLLESLENREFGTEKEFWDAIKEILKLRQFTLRQFKKYKPLILDHARRLENRNQNDILVVSEKTYYKLSSEFFRMLRVDDVLRRLASLKDKEFDKKDEFNFLRTIRKLLTPGQFNIYRQLILDLTRRPRDRNQPVRVGTFKPNAFGLYDMHGNVWEWCADPWHENYRGAPTDGRVWEEGGNAECRVLRGGSWEERPSKLRCAYRKKAEKYHESRDCGFRVVCSNVIQ